MINQGGSIRGSGARIGGTGMGGSRASRQFMRGSGRMIRNKGLEC
jgi:hypothetical protein